MGGAGKALGTRLGLDTSGSHSKDYFKKLFYTTRTLAQYKRLSHLNLTNNKIIPNTFNARKDGLFASVARETFGTHVESLSKDFGGIIFESLLLWQFVAASHRRPHKCNKVSWMYKK